MEDNFVHRLVEILQNELCSNWTYNYIENVIRSHQAELDTLIGRSQADSLLYVADKQYQRGREAGIKEALENLPKWVKSDYTLTPLGEKHCRIWYNGYTIDIDELFNKLPKNDQND